MSLHHCLLPQLSSCYNIIVTRLGKSLHCAVLCLVAQSCLTLCDPIDYSPPGSSVHKESPGKSTGVGCHALLQVILPTRGSNPGLPHCRWILNCLNYQRSSRIREWAAYPFSKGTSPPRDQTKVSCIAGRVFFFFFARRVFTS